MKKLLGHIAIITIMALTFTFILIFCNDRFYNHNMQMELLNTTVIKDTIKHKVEIGEHKYIIYVWGDDLEYTKSCHSFKCCNY